MNLVVVEEVSAEKYRVDLLNRVLKIKNVKELSSILHVAPGTITRWLELDDVPKQYEFDFLKLLSIPIAYAKYSPKDKDQFFTPVSTAAYCYEVFRKFIENKKEPEYKYTYIEPSAGNGSFLQVLPQSRTLAFDIEPMHPNILQQDYLEWRPVATDTKAQYVVFGNPPFGLRGHLALRFINHSYEFADYVCFILPQLFESDGKGVPRKRVEGFHLVHSEKLQSEFYGPAGKPLKINTIFQIWSKHHTNATYELNETVNNNLKIYSLSDGGTPSTTRNKKMLNACDVYLPSTCFGKENMKCYTSFEDLPGKKGYGLVFYNNDKTSEETNENEYYAKCLTINWGEVAFLSTNSAYNLRSSQIYNMFL